MIRRLAVEVAASALMAGVFWIAGILLGRPGQWQPFEKEGAV